MLVQRVLLAVDAVSIWIGKTFAWLIVVLVIVVGYDVVARFLFRSPTGYAFEVGYYLYATLFMVGGAYALARNQHVRGDFFYRNWPVRVQAAVEVVMMVFFFFPAMIALVSSGWQFFFAAFLILERTQTSAVSLPLWPLKGVIPLAGVLMLVQGVVEFTRGLIALRTGVWPRRLSDVEETETILASQETL
jgi:TRAP-type mannitol/chloroaromatic compound transport system permease small subunit